MALNVLKILIDGVWTAVEARTGFTDEVKLADRVKTADHDYVDRDARRKAIVSGYPRAMCYGTGDSLLPQPKTFRTGSAVATLDYGVPRNETIEFKLILDALQDTATTTLEAEVEAALMKLPINLHAAGYRWIGGLTWRKTRRNERNADTGNVLRTVVRWAITAETRPKLSALIA